MREFDYSGKIMSQQPAQNSITTPASDSNVASAGAGLGVDSLSAGAGGSSVAQRPDVSENVSDAIVKFGDDTALDHLIRNDGAKISRARRIQCRNSIQSSSWDI